MTHQEKEDRIKAATHAYSLYMDITLPGWEEDPNAKDTPLRVAKAWFNDIAEGLYADEPKITSFENVNKYPGIVFEGPIPVKSLCSHHHQNIDGFAYLAYIPEKEGKIIGLSKLDRIVEYYARRPQVQENLTMQILEHMKKVIGMNRGIAVFIKAKHMCVSHRGVRHDHGVMQTCELSGVFIDQDNKSRDEFYRMIDFSGREK